MTSRYGKSLDGLATQCTLCGTPLILIWQMKLLPRLPVFKRQASRWAHVKCTVQQTLRKKKRHCWKPAATAGHCAEPTESYVSSPAAWEVLLHEMIHAYIFTKGWHRRDGDLGPLTLQSQHLSSRPRSSCKDFGSARGPVARDDPCLHLHKGLAQARWGPGPLDTAKPAFVQQTPQLMQGLWQCRRSCCTR